ncbi:hypothetical protein AZI87_13100 [Bdellovibrio bacteriovorus]|uniref:O-antigen ligase-related domain-containing protein n=1 Tax=Bdellovibrio bacteriovorus TaxID=959 RepID=A0A162G2T2_BDEBC|nr:O-antigen ligase family protein [Bdellovibrio bacteriovorus]KYG64179.1 hypothetical protein AZI87_13100 [Bdellovibrio bacteriovorus]
MLLQLSNDGFYFTMHETKHNLVSTLATILFTLCLVVSLFSRNLGEYSFDLIIIFIIIVTLAKATPWSWNTLSYHTGFYKWVYFFYFWIFLTILLNPPIHVKSFGYLLEFLWIPALPLFARVLSLWRPEKFFVPAFAIITSISVSAIIAHYFLVPENPNFFGYPNRLQGTFTNINFLAHSYFLVFLLVLGLLVTHIQSNQRRLALILGFTALTLLLSLFLTFTRTIWISVILAMPIMCFLVNKRTALRIFLASCVIFGTLFISDAGGTRGRIVQTLSTNKGDTIRLTLWRTSLKIFRDNPIFGVGYMNNKRDIMTYLKKYEEQNVTTEFDTHPHNEILSFLAGTGLIGTVLYIGNFVLFFLLGLKSFRLVGLNEPVKRGLLLGAITIQPAFLIAGFADNNFEIHVARNWLVISWAILIWIATETKTTININIKKLYRKPAVTR